MNRTTDVVDFESYPKIALIAHDNQKSMLRLFVQENDDYFRYEKLVATEKTGRELQNFGFTVQLVPHGPRGGDVVIGSMICNKEIKAVFFLRDVLTVQPHEPDVHALLRMCDIYQIPLATNLGTANCVLNYLRMIADEKTDSTVVR